MSLIKSIIFIVLVVGFSCTKGFSQDPITFNIESASGTQGSTVCIDITVEDFMKVLTSQFVLRFDPNVVQLDTPIIVTNSELTNLSIANFNYQQIGDGFLNFVWFDPAPGGLTLDDDAIIFTLCFEIIGDPCQSTSICFAEKAPLTYEFLAIDCVNGLTNDFLPNVNKGTITVDPDGYDITAAFCSTDENSNSGSITFSGYGGVGPYDWTVTPGTAMGTGLDDCETVTVDNLGPGTYTITLIDSNNSIIAETVTISTNSDFPFVVNLEGTNPTCFDLLNGTVIVTDIEGGEAPFVYEWSTFEFLEDTIIKLGPGDYGLTLTDANGCKTSSEVTLAVDTLSLSYEVISDPSCEENATDGIVSIFAEGGTPFPGGNYNFDIDGIIVNMDTTNYFGGSNGLPVNPFTPANLPSGCFEVTATDNATIGCVSDPIQFCIEAGEFSVLEIEVTDISCFGECDGEISMSLGILGGFDVMVTDPSGAVVTEMGTLSYMDDNLCSGTYNVTIDDLDAGCSLDTFFVITEPDLLELVVIDSLGPGCGGGDGMIEFEISGGTEDYTIEWNDSFDQLIRTNMVGGDYSVTITDMNGCQDSISFSFEVGGTVGLNAFVCNAESCGGANDASICANVTSAGSFTFTWADSSGTEIGTGAQLDGVGGGTYFVTATDGSCVDTDTVFVVPGDTPSISIEQTDPTCFDSEDGTLTATLETGANPATFEWLVLPSTVVLTTGAVFTGGVGTYDLRVTDFNGCVLDTAVIMTPPVNSIQIDITNIVANTCFGECEGGATFTASGGPAQIGSYGFVISGESVNPGTDVATLNTICGGENWVVASDGTCSSDTFFFTIPDGIPISLNESNSVLNPPSCEGGDDGSITIEVEGGNSSSYDIFWVDEGIMGPTLTGLTSGSYIYNVTDGNNCVFVDTIDLVTPDALMVSVNTNTTTPDLGCSNDAVGEIGLITSGGNSGNLVYAWDPVVSNTDFAENLGPGIYSVTVTDSKGCSAETSYELTSAPPVEAIFGVPDEPNCFGGQTCISIDTAFGGVGNVFTFSIVNGGLPFPIDTCVGVFAGEYNVTVFDSTGCSVDTTFIIDQPEEVIVDLGPDVTISLGDSTGPISAFIVSELDIDSIFWDPITDLECNTDDCQIVTFSPLGTTNYTITVVDENGCLVSDDINVIVDLARHVYFPNIFSPNGDNQNDFFQLATGSGVLEVTYFRLFDRWGNMVHEDLSYMPDDSVHPGWDGRFNNREVEAGIYVYFAEVLFEDNVRVLYKGDVTMVR